MIEPGRNAKGGGMVFGEPGQNRPGSGDYPLTGGFFVGPPRPGQVNPLASFERTKNAGVPWQDDDAIAIVYGRDRIQCRKVWSAYEGASWARHLFVVCAGEIQEYESITAAQSTDDTGTVLSESSTLIIRRHYGAANQAVDDMIYSYVGNHRLPGLAYFTVEVAFSDGQYTAVSEYNIFADIKGRKVYDPRDATTAYKTNAALCIRDFLTDMAYGGGVAASKLNETTWEDAADACDTLVYDLHLVVGKDGTASSWIEAMRGSCAGELYMHEGKYCFFVDGAQAASGLVFTEGLNLKDLRFSWLGSTDRPTRVIVYFQAFDSVTEDSRQADHPSLAAGLVPVVPTEYHFAGVKTAATAQQLATYYERVARLRSLQVEGTVSFQGIQLRKTQRISLVTNRGFSGDVLVENFNRLDTDEYRVMGRKYDAAVYA